MVMYLVGDVGHTLCFGVSLARTSMLNVVFLFMLEINYGY
jgi:hypothetical protein